LHDIGLQNLPDVPINLDTPDTYNIANGERVRAMVIRTLDGLRTRCGVAPGVLCTLFRNLTSEGTAVGYLAQLQGYDWLLHQETTFAAEVNHPKTVRERPIDLDGRIDLLGEPVFFDIKSFGFEPDLRATFQRRLEAKLPNHIIMINGPGNHGPDTVQREAFAQLSNHVTALTNGDRIDIPALGWTVRKRKRAASVNSAEHEYDPPQFIHENREVPLKNASQFTTDAPYILFYVLPDGVGSSPMKNNVFGFAEEVFAGIAGHLFGAGRTDQSDASRLDGKVPAGTTIADVVTRLSGLALYSPQANLAELHLNGQAASPISQQDAVRIAAGWNVILYP
jgi:hypothetical protein